MKPEEAISRTIEEVEKDPRLRIVAISGPGEPLVNEETFTTLEGIRNQMDHLNFCLSTNGVLLEEKVPRLKELGIRSISVSMSAIFPDTAARVYEWARINGKKLKGKAMGEYIIQKQLAGIERSVALGITVKVNTVLMPGINNEEINHLAKQISNAGASLQNIVPLVLCTINPDLKIPTREEIDSARFTASLYIHQFTHCKQCRSDVVGIPGRDRVL
jgi:nitrogen fixation protein NifB